MSKWQKVAHWTKTGVALLLVAVALLVNTTPAAANVAKAASNLNSLFYQANGYYEAGAYQKAVDTYEQILDSGYTSGNLYYNLANSYYRIGEKGRALANYLRAKRIIPRDPDLRANLEQVQMDLQLVEDQGGFMQWFAAKLTDILTAREMSVVASVFFTVLTLAILAWLYWPKGKRYMMLAMSGAALCLLLTIAGLGIISLMTGVDEAVVVVKEAKVRFEPTLTGETHYTLGEGVSADIESTREGWVQVRRKADGKKGWVRVEEVEPISD